jgi:hypothetical protein
MEFCVSMAGVAVRVVHKYEHIRLLCEDYLTDDEPVITVTATDEEIEAECEITNGEFPPEICEGTCIHRAATRALVKYGVMLIHSAVITVDGEAYVFMAKSGVGKSTHIRLWQKVFGERAVVLNGDKPYFTYENGVLTAHGTPWRGKEFLGCNMKAPVRGMCILHRGLENSISPATSRDAVGQIFHQVLLPQDGADLASFMAMMDKIIKNVPMYNLYCNMEDDAARVAYNGMRGN